MRKMNFLFGIHNHQPVGNFPEVLEKAYQDSYRPFAETLARHPQIQWSLHASGILWDFLVEKHPEYIESLGKMVSAGQVELLTGGYYEPIISAIPDRDKIGQIRKMTDFLEKTFGVRAKGMWLAERVWEPQLARVLHEAGVEFTVVDDAHFSAAGMDVEQLRGYYITEEQGVPLSIFPISQRLRYSIPFQTIDKTIEHFSSVADENGCPALVMADDGEKFGLWPETYKHVYQDGWLENFLNALEQNREWVQTTTFSGYRAKCPPAGRVYLPTASYFEMSEWSLPPQAQEEFEGVAHQFEHAPQIRRFLRGGFWRNFLTKYDESNNMHKKMLYVSSRVQQMEKKKSAKQDVTAAQDALYAGQCNCAYWHGVFGGLYLPHLRTAVYRELLKAEMISGRHLAVKPSWKNFDFDGDGREEALFESTQQNLYFAPHRGGALFEWDLPDRGVNLQNVLTRRQESYHRRLREYLSHPPQADHGAVSIHDMVKVKEQNLDQYLHYDWYRRSSLLDHFFHPATKFDDVRRTQYGEQGDFVLGEYQASVKGKQLSLHREGTVWVNEKPFRISVTKLIVPQPDGMKVTYTVRNCSEETVELFFAPEFNFGFSFMTGEDTGEHRALAEWVRHDEHFGFVLRMRFSSPHDLWVFPVETVSLSEGGFEKTYQGTVVLPLNRISIPAGGVHADEIVLQRENR